MFPLRPPFFGYPFNNFYNYNSRRNNYYPYNIPYNKNINSVRSNSPNITPTMPEPLAVTEAMQSEQSRNYEKKDSSSEPFDSYFFEIFGLKLYFDDILLICLLFFLYEEGVKDQELFISLILLLLS